MLYSLFRPTLLPISEYSEFFMYLPAFNPYQTRSPERWNRQDFYIEPFPTYPKPLLCPNTFTSYTFKEDQPINNPCQRRKKGVMGQGEY